MITCTCWVRRQPATAASQFVGDCLDRDCVMLVCSADDRGPFRSVRKWSSLQTVIQNQHSVCNCAIPRIEQAHETRRAANNRAAHPLDRTTKLLGLSSVTNTNTNTKRTARQSHAAPRSPQLRSRSVGSSVSDLFRNRLLIVRVMHDD